MIPPIAGTDRDPEVLAKRSPDQKWLKFMRFKSDVLSRFWGQDVFLGAWILLPDGFDEHPDAHYPLIVYQDHFSAGFRPAGFYQHAARPQVAHVSARSERLSLLPGLDVRAGCRA